MTVDMIPNISINILSSVKSNKVLNTTPAKTKLGNVYEKVSKLFFGGYRF